MHQDKSKNFFNCWPFCSLLFFQIECSVKKQRI